ncbi:AAA family ATPase [Actinobaculum sp. 352]|uniref:AAA family ATPase n=1 Tax=Actinobaculum sp. 352 TaxID=2490946 RepID=UPI0019D1149B|nr:AAA family ATPase [Actinobaculum sp. 352]
MPQPLLIILGGLPATGKTTVAHELIHDGGFAYLRIDTIEQALRDSGEMGERGVEGAGYAVGYAVARDLLRSGNNVLAECVNPIELTREAWRAVARSTRAELLEVELYCADPELHQARAEHRTSDIPGLELPDWHAITTREYDQWHGVDLRIDTARIGPPHAAALIRARAADKERLVKEAREPRDGGGV